VGAVVRGKGFCGEERIIAQKCGDRVRVVGGEWFTASDLADRDAEYSLPGEVEVTDHVERIWHPFHIDVSHEVVEEPPIGCVPEVFYQEQRLRDLAEAIHQSVHGGFFGGKDAIRVQVWCDELQRRVGEFR